MRRYYQAAGVIILAFALYVMYESRFGIDYRTEYGPGPGYLPFWCGVFLAVFTLAWLIQVTFRPVEGLAATFYPDRGGIMRILSVMAAMILFSIFMTILGFQLTILPFLFCLLLILGRQKILPALALSVAVGWGLTYIFRNLLDVPLPLSAFDFLSNLGL